MQELLVFKSQSLKCRGREGNGSIDTKLLVVGLSEPVFNAVPQVKSLKAKGNFANEQPVFPHTSRNMRRNEKPRKFSRPNVVYGSNVEVSWYSNRGGTFKTRFRKGPPQMQD